MKLPSWFEEDRQRIEETLDKLLPGEDTPPPSIHRAMRYSVFAGGKRLRPILCIEAARVFQADILPVLPVGCALEFIHTYSLIHDDLPALDNDDLRRGKPTCHKQFGEATAILAGDALQTLAFYILAHDPAMTADARARLAMIENLALAAGSRGMVGGQAIDFAAVGRSLDIAELEIMHIHKTGALIRAAVRLAALSASGLNQTTLQQLDHYAKCVGLAFQIRDDILDVEGDVAVTGKRQGADLALNKPTYPSLLGLAEAKRRAAYLHEEALASLTALDERAEPLRGLSHYIVERVQ
jgi:geranylgeranyl pyrophosphate synthase